MPKESQALAALNALVEQDVKQMLDLAKKATGKSQKFLITDAIRSKYSKYLKQEKSTVLAV